VAIRAWRILRDKADFCIAGRGAWPAEAGLHVLGEVNEEELSRLYAGAAALVFPSLYEGFGLPLLEAMQSGTPVIASRDPALVEVAGTAAVHVDPLDPGAWTRAMLEALRDGSRLREAGLRRAGEFSWESTARTMRDVYHEAARRFALGG
jgi:alpha-1,3-rhamnosyl/mannosyltransferase